MKNQSLLAMILVAAVVISGCTQYSQTATTTPASGGQQTTPSVETAKQPSLTVSAQSLSGNQINIDSFYLDKPGFVVVHESVNGNPGAVIGHSDVVSGEMQNFKVTINSSEAGTKVFAMLHYDDNGNGVFDFPAEDKPITVGGDVLVKPIDIIQATVTNQTLAPNTIQITSAGFSPNPLTVKAGSTVTWINMDSSPHWPASAAHPSHNIYPEGGGCIGSKFDACKNLAPGESWSFTFNRVGSWNYHDHLNPVVTGIVLVQGG